MAKKINDDVLDELLKGCERPEDLLGDGGLMTKLKKALMQRMLGAELTEHLGYEHGEEAPPVQTNRRNGVSRKTLKGESGAFEIEVPRDREGSFEPRLIGKGQTEAVTQAVRGEIARVTEAAAPQSDRGLAEELLAIGHETAPLFKEPFKSMDHGEFLYDEETGLPK